MSVRTKAYADRGVSDGFTDDALDHLLDEAERALLDVEARADEPGRRMTGPDAEVSGLDILRLAVAELSDAHPGMHYELEGVAERFRTVGAHSAAMALEQHPHVLDVVRLSLEAFFLQYPTLRAYENDYERSEDAEDDERLASETYSLNQQLLQILRRRLS